MVGHWLYIHTFLFGDLGLSTVIMGWSPPSRQLACRANEEEKTVLVHPSFRDDSKGYNHLGATTQTSFCHLEKRWNLGRLVLKVSWENTTTKLQCGVWFPGSLRLSTRHGYEALQHSGLLCSCSCLPKSWQEPSQAGEAAIRVQVRPGDGWHFWLPALQALPPMPFTPQTTLCFLPYLLHEKKLFFSLVSL